MSIPERYRDVDRLMRPIVVVDLDKRRPALLMTREITVPHLRKVTVAPITSTVRGLSTEVPVEPANCLDHESAINCYNIMTVPAHRLEETIGYLLPAA